MYKRLTIFFSINLFIIFTLSFYLETSDVINHFYGKKILLPVFGYLKHDVYDNKYFSNYLADICLEFFIRYIPPPNNTKPANPQIKKEFILLFFISYEQKTFSWYI